jgi:hypothetical protein
MPGFFGKLVGQRKEGGSQHISCLAVGQSLE